METKWTPGPWKRRDGAEWIVDAARGYGRVASVGLGRDEADANAHLIAAAPDLYAALEAAMAFIESHVADPDITDEMIRNYNALQDLKPRAALAKARGEA